MPYRTPALIALIATALLASWPAAAADTGATSLSLRDVLHEVLENHPDLSLSRLQVDLSATGTDKLEGMLDPQVKLSGNYSDETQPTTSPFAASGTNIAGVSGSISKPLADGSTLSGSLQYNRTRLNYPATVPTAFQSSLNPAYQSRIDLTYRYPLLRGHGNPSYHEQKAASEQDTAAARWSVDVQRQALSQQALALYYQVAADEISVQLSQEAVGRAEKLLQYQKFRENLGLIETADRLQAEALLTTRRLDLANARAALRRDRTDLNRLMLHAPDQPLRIGLGQQKQQLPSPPQVLDKLLQRAEQQRPEFRVIDARLAASEARLIAARDEHKTSVDLVGQVGSRALTGSAGTAFNNSFTVNDRFVGLGIEVSDTIGDHASEASIRAAELTREQALLQKRQARENIKTELADARTALLNARSTLQAARQRAAVEKRKFAAEMQRYRQGRTDTATIVQFEGDLRNAELQAALQAITAEMAARRIELATGTLLSDITAGRAGSDRP